MSIIYVLAAQGTKVLCDYTNYSGNVDKFCISILKRVPQNSRGSYEYDENYSFHFLNADGMTYLTMCEKNYPQTSAIQFLESIKKELEESHGTNFNSMTQYELNPVFKEKLAMKMEYYNTNKDNTQDNIALLKNSIINIKDDLLKDDELLNQRGEKIQLIVEKASNLAVHSDTYYNSAKSVKRNYWWKKMKLTIILSIIGLIAIFVIVLIACGGFNFSRCKKK